MDFFKKIFKSSNFWPILIVIVAALLAGRTLMMSGYFNMHDDLQMMRQLEMEKCFKDLQIPCRWVPDMGYGYGFPLFNYYPPLPYLTGEIFRLVGFSFVNTAKMLFLLAFLASGVSMYFLAKEFFGRWGGVVSSVFYIWAPYHSVDVYVRGAMNEDWGLIWFPLILLTSYKLIKEKKNVVKWIVGLGLSWVGLLLSHNLMVLIFTPVFVGWCLIFWLRTRDWKKIIQFLLSGFLVFALSAFFTLPALFEQKYVQINTLVMGYYEYIAHFATIGQLLFSRFWGYGASVWGPNDGMPFQVGHIHWVLSLVIAAVVAFYLLRKKLPSSTKEIFLIVLYMFCVGWFAVFMAHSRSTFIWQFFSPLKFVQFPWRFLTIVILCFSFISGSIVTILEPLGKLKWIIPGALMILLIVIDWNYFLPVNGKMGPLTDVQKFSGAAWDLQRTAGIFDYLPVTAKENPKAPPTSLVEIMTGKALVSDSTQGTDWAKFKVDISSSTANLRVDIFDFPVWKAYVDGKETKITVPDTEKWGRMYVDVPKGVHSVSFELTSTPLRTIGNYLSLVSWLLLIPFIIWVKKILDGKLA